MFDAKCRKSRGPLTVFARPNDLGHSRLGLSVSRQVGGAVVRAGIKRRLREAFRLMPETARGSYDFVVTVRKHEATKMQAYSEWLGGAMAALDREWRKRSER